MKRVADKQLIRDETDTDDADVEEPGKGFKLADESVLATRKIRALPKRVAGGSFAGAGSAPAPVVATSPADPPPKFGGFTGFGAPNSSMSSFTFNASSTTTTAPTNSRSLFSGFGTTPSSTTSSTTTSTPSSTAKTFASFLSTSTNGATDTSKSGASDVPKPNSPESDKDKRAVEYYSSLRGLNISLLDAVKKYVDEDPFFDISELLERYKSLRTNAQKDFDLYSPPSASTSQSKPAEAPKLSMPAPPSGFVGFGSFGTSASTSSSSSQPPKPSAMASEGSKSSMPTPPSSFIGFGKPATTSNDTNKTAGSSTFAPAFGATDSSASFSAPSSLPFPFGAPPAPSNSSSATSLFGSSNKDSNPFPTSGSSSAPSSLPFTFGKSADSSSTTKPDAPISSLPFSFSKTSAPASTEPKEVSKSVFGSISKDDDAKEEAKDKPASSSPFSSSASSTLTPSNPFGTFGRSSSANPVSFGFGSPALSASSTPAAESTPKPGFSFGPTSGSGSTGFTFGGTSSSTGFSFGGSSSSSLAAKEEEGQKEENKEGSVAPTEGAASASDGTVSVFGVNPHDEEGEGEEDEVTVHAVKSKAYRMKKPDEKGGPGWVEIGYGILRLKKHKENDSRRMLLRNSTTGKINLNFKLYSGLKPSQAKKAVTFVGHDNGVAQTYSVRVGTEQQAIEFKEALEKEVKYVKAKEV